MSEVLSAEAEELKQQARALFMDIVRLNPEPVKRAAFCKQLFYGNDISEELKHVLIRQVFTLPPNTQWAYQNVSDHKFMNTMLYRTPFKLSYVPYAVKNPHLTWSHLERMMYLNSDKWATKTKTQIRNRLLEQFPDSYYAQFSAEFMELTHNTKFQRTISMQNIRQRVKVANGWSEDVPDEWLEAMFS